MFKPSPTPPLFQPLNYNSLHQAGPFSTFIASPSRPSTPLFIKSASPSPMPRSLAASPLPSVAGPQRSSGLKDVYTVSHSLSPGSKRTVRWATPLEDIKPIPSRDVALDIYINNVESFVTNEWLGNAANPEPGTSVATPVQRDTINCPPIQHSSPPPVSSNETHRLAVSFEDIAQNKYSRQKTYETPSIFESRSIAAPKPRRPQELITRVNLLHMQQIHERVESSSFLHDGPPFSALNHITSPSTPTPASVGNNLLSGQTQPTDFITTNSPTVKGPRNASPPGKTVLRENTTNNLPSSSRLAQHSNNGGNHASTSRLPLPTRINGNTSILGKRRPPSPDLNKRPTKASKTDVDSSTPLTGGLNIPLTKFPSLEPLEDALDVVARTPSRTPPPPPPHVPQPLQPHHSESSRSVPIQSSNRQQSRSTIYVDDDGDVEMYITDADDSDNDSLFGDPELLEVPAVGEEISVVSRKELEAPVSLNQTRRPLTLLRVVEWTNRLRSYDFLIKNNKFTWRHDNELFELLEKIDAEKDNSFMTPTTFTKNPALPRLITELKRHDLLEAKTKRKLKNIERFWRRLLRDAPE